MDAYLDALPEPVRARFAALADVVRDEAPDATERISYGMPTWHQGENLVHLGAAQRHIGVYPGPEAIVALADELTKFKTSKGAIQIPHDAALPVDLLRRVVRWRLDAVAAKGR
jgi:uncharacterized protein YdhG (YjbR/CyaY superfamily)